VAAAAETWTSHRVTRVRVAPAPAPRYLSYQVRDTYALRKKSRNWMFDVLRAKSGIHMCICAPPFLKTRSKDRELQHYMMIPLL